VSGNRARALTSACALLVAALVTAGCGTVGLSEEGTGDRVRGKELFSEHCGSCHTLADAGTKGVIGPNLDDAFVQSRADGIGDTTIQSIVRGQIAYPTEQPPTGLPGMPADLVTGEDADAVAAYVASVAGLPVQPSGAPEAGGETEPGSETEAGGETEPGETTPEAGGGTEPAGAAIFADSGCGSCHTLAAAGTSGTIGPNLDETKPSKELAIERITNGAGAMPPFADSLSPEQIEMVADYVASSAGR
jgi:mono/diheme cytochrome c family protein